MIDPGLISTSSGIDLGSALVESINYFVHTTKAIHGYYFPSANMSLMSFSTSCRHSTGIRRGGTVIGGPEVGMKWCVSQKEVFVEEMALSFFLCI